MKDSIEKNLKRWLKNKVKITMSLITIFLITGSIGYGANLKLISGDVALTENSTAAGFASNLTGKTIKITGNYDLTLDGDNINVFNSQLDFSEADIEIEGKTIFKNYKMPGDYLGIVNTSSNNGSKINFKGGLDIIDSQVISGVVIRTQNSDFKADSIKVDNLDLSDTGDPHAGVISAIINSDFNIEKDVSITDIVFANKQNDSFARGIFLYGSRLSADSINIDNLTTEGEAKVYGINAQDFTDGVSFVKGNNITVKNLKGNGSEVAGIFLERAYLRANDEGFENSVIIDNIISEVENSSVYGLHSMKNQGYVSSNEYENSLEIKGDLSVSNIASVNGDAYGVYLNGVENVEINNLTVDKIGGKNLSEGIYLNSSSNININNLNIKNITVKDTSTERVIALNSSNSTVNVNNVIIQPESEIEYLGVYNIPASIEQEAIDIIAIRSVNDSVVNMNNPDGIYKISGSIVAGSGGKTNEGINYKGGKIDISGNTTQILGDIFAGNGGEISLRLSGEESFIEGQIDDYHELGTIKIGSTFHNSKFTDEAGNPLDVTEAGKVTLSLDDGAQWIALGKSYLNSLDNNGIVDMTTVENSSITVHDLSGNGIIKMKLNSIDKDNSDMLYVSGSINGTQTIEVEWANEEGINGIKSGDRLRFATTQKGNEEIQAYTTEAGIFNIKYLTETDDYDSEIEEEENILYNSEKAGRGYYKPGNEFTDEYFAANGLNHYIVAVESETLNDGGKSIIEMSKANYAGAVYLDNLNKRLGDMRFANGKEGFWVRLRHDRVGEDSEYRLYNYMTQLGYDKPYPMDEGKGTEYKGIALEITTGDMEYKNINGDADIDRQALWLYDTNMYNNGFYSDYVFRIGRMESEFGIYGRETGARVEGNYKNLFLGASAEYGYRLELSEKTYFEPQVQLQYTYIDETDYSTNQDTKVKLDDIHSVIGRVGARLGHDFYNDEGRNIATVYAKADINHEFLGEQRVEAKDSTGVLDKKYENDGTWYDIGIGVSKEVTPDFNVYMDIERQVGRTRDDQSWQVNLGFRYILGK